MIGGDIHWIEFPDRGGHTQAGRRPALLVQKEDISTRLPTILAIPLTTRIEALRFPGTVLIEADVINGLRRNSVALVFQLTVQDQKLIGTRLGSVTKKTLQDIWSAFEAITER